MRLRDNKNGFHSWTAAEIACAAKVYAQALSAMGPARGQQARAVRAVAQALGLPSSKVHARLQHYGPDFAGYGQRGERHSRTEIPADVIAERERYATAASARSLTASVLGDPPPGYSALDRLRGGR